MSKKTRKKTAKASSGKVARGKSAASAKSSGKYISQDIRQDIRGEGSPGDGEQVKQSQEVREFAASNARSAKACGPQGNRRQGNCTQGRVRKPVREQTTATKSRCTRQR